MSRAIPISEARERVLAAARPLETELVAVGDALGRVLARTASAAADVPPFDPSAMDGYAVPAGAEGELRVVGEARAGRPYPGTLAPGEAVRISTGAPVPAGADAVAPVEVVEEGEGAVRVPLLPSGANVRRRGDDMRSGAAVVTAGTSLGPAEVGVLAGAGLGEVECFRRPRVAIVATGDELVAPGTPLGPGQIWSSNPVALAAQAVAAGAAPEVLPPAADEPGPTREALRAALGADVVLVSGGVSVGPHDHVKPALAELGVAESFWGVALKPGKPLWFGAADGGPLVFGLPGNPVSAMVTFQLFARPALRVLQGADPAPAVVRAELASSLELRPARAQAIRVRLEQRPGAPALAHPTGAQESHRLTSMLGADGLALLDPGEGSAQAGDEIAVELLGGYGLER